MYGKLFEQMYDGTLVTRGPWQALITFQQIIILADRNGVVDMTPETIARRTTIPLKIIKQGIAVLEQPDPDSRTPDEQGRRIVRLSDARSWGWRIVNHARYRAIRSQEERRDYHRRYWEEKRSPKGKQSSKRTQHYSTNSTNGKKQEAGSRATGSKKINPSIRKNDGHDEFREGLEGPAPFEKEGARGARRDSPNSVKEMA